MAIDTQEIVTQVVVKSGETVILGRIFQQHTSRQNSNVPVLGNIPILGGLFRYKNQTLQKRELVIFITLDVLNK